jgi:hypothetical protein
MIVISEEVHNFLYVLYSFIRSLETFRFPQIILIRKLVVDYNRLLQVQMKYFQNGGTSGNTGNRRHLHFFNGKASF